MRLTEEQSTQQHSSQATRARNQTCDRLSLPLDGCARPRLSDAPARRRAAPLLAIILLLTVPLVGDADPNGTASGDPTDLRFDRPYRANSPIGLPAAAGRSPAPHSAPLPRLHVRCVQQLRQ
eukprot:5664156-Pleurochrysis_carterae.AAC.1